MCARPRRQAVAEFLSTLGYTPEELLNGIEALPDAVLAYHTFVGVPFGPSQVFAEAEEVLVDTVSGGPVIFRKTSDGFTVTDLQGNTAKAVKVGLGERQSIHVIDKVLFSPSYFKSLQDLVKALPKAFKNATALVTKAGDKTLTEPGFSGTIFLPTDKVRRVGDGRRAARAAQAARWLHWWRAAAPSPGVDSRVNNVGSLPRAPRRSRPAPPAACARDRPAVVTRSRPRCGTSVRSCATRRATTLKSSAPMCLSARAWRT